MPGEQVGPNEQEMQAIPRILSFFELGQMTDASVLSEGDANHNYLVKTPDREEYVIKFAIEESKESLENDRAIQLQLVKAGMITPVYLYHNGKFIYEDGARAVVSRRIDGVHPKFIDGETSESIGRMLAGFHKAVDRIPHARQAWLNPDFVEKPTAFEDDPLIKKAREFLGESKDIYDGSMPRGIIHGDIHSTNLMVDSHNPRKVTAVFDFEEAEENLLIVDIARTVLAIAAVDEGRILDPGLIESFVNGYSSVRQLSDEERKNLPKAIKYAAGACMLWYVKNGMPERARNAISRIESLAVND